MHTHIYVYIHTHTHTHTHILHGYIIQLHMYTHTHTHTHTHILHTHSMSPHTHLLPLRRVIRSVRIIRICILHVLLKMSLVILPHSSHAVVAEVQLEAEV